MLALCEREEGEKGEKEGEEVRRAGNTSKFFREARGQRRRKKKRKESAGRTRRGRGPRRRKRTRGIGREKRRKAQRRGDDEAEAPDRREVMRSTKEKEEEGTSEERERERERKSVRQRGRRRGERGKAARSQGGLFGDRRRRRAKNEQNGSERTRLELSAFALPCPTRLASPPPRSPHPLVLLVFVFCLASPRLCLPARHEMANTPELKLRSHANATARLHRLSWSSSFFLPSLT